MRRGDQGEDVRKAQTRLNAHGWKPALVLDGVFGEKTDRAVRWFQRQKGLSVDGIVGRRTWKALLAAPVASVPWPDTPLLWRGSNGDMVKTLQRYLNDQGEDLAIDGVFGAKTEAAVKRFQRAQGLVVDGLVGPRTWRALMAAV